MEDERIRMSCEAIYQNGHWSLELTGPLFIMDQVLLGLVKTSSGTDVDTGRRTAVFAVGARPDAHLNEYRALLSQGRVIDAIRLYRSRTNKSLKDSKDFIESLR